MHKSQFIKALVLCLNIAVLNSSGAELRGQERNHPLDPVIRIVNWSLRKIEQIPAYKATVTKRELGGK